MRDKGLATAVATLLAAFATAHLMQFGLSAGRLAAGEDAPAPIGLATLMARQTGAAPAALPEGPAPLPVAAAFAGALPPPAARALPPDAGVPGTLGQAPTNGMGLPCARRLAAETAPGAMLRMRVEAPCDPGVRIEVRHEGLRFSLRTGSDGRVEAQLPAMRTDARVEARFADGTVLGARAAVPEAAEVERVAVVADGWAALTLHAFEAGARRDAPGHVHAGAPGPRDGALLRLGDAGVEAPIVSEVYTLPSGRFGPLGGVRFEVEAVVTPGNCARDLVAEVLRSGGAGPPDRMALGLAMPPCEALGDVLVIGLPSPDLRLAKR